MRRFFIDMDGVLAEWEDASIEEMTSKNFFLSRKPDLNVCDMLKLLIDRQEQEGIEIYILSSYLLPISKAEKIEWNKKYTNIPLERQIYVPYGEDKAKALSSIGGIREDDVLLDDFTWNLKRWPGIAVKLYNGINGTHGTWDGFSIHNNMSPFKMVCQLDGISMMETVRIQSEREMMNAKLSSNEMTAKRRAAGR